MKKLLLLLLIPSLTLAQGRDAPKYLEFRTATAEARSHGDCVKSSVKDKIYQPTVDGRWAVCMGRGVNGETHWTVSDQELAEFYAKETKAGGWKVVKCEECR